MPDLPRDAEPEELAPLLQRREHDCPPPELILPALEGTLEPELLRTGVCAHIEDCRACQELVRALEDAAGILRREEERRINASVSQALQSEGDADPRPPSR